jgi:type IV pilus assembly protein PilV
MTPRHTASRSLGFSLVEVMVALIVIAVGLLGIAKMQALALASTTSASMRSLAALEATSLAASMHADRDYWDNSPPVTINAVGASVTSTTAGFPVVGANCTSTGTIPCDVTTLASYDLEQWATALSYLLPNASAMISCPANQTPPLSCTILISWTENAVAVNSQEATATTTAEAFQIPTYTLYVEP